MEDLRKGWKATNIFERLGIREPQKKEGEWMVSAGLGIMAVAGTLLCGGEEEEKIMVVDHVQDPKLS